MSRKTIVIHRNDEEIEVVLRTATLEDGLYRTDLISTAASIPAKLMAKYRRIAAILIHPSCVACVESPEDIRNMDVDEFLKLPEIEIEQWAEASGELNPHWKKEQIFQSKETIEKKISTPSNGSRKSTRARKIMETSPS